MEGKQLVAWMYDRGSLALNENFCHAYLLLVDFRSDKPPYNIYIYEPMGASTRAVAPRLISNMVLVSKQQRLPVVSGTAKGLFVYGTQKVHETNRGPSQYKDVVLPVYGSPC